MKVSKKPVNEHEIEEREDNNDDCDCDDVAKIRNKYTWLQMRWDLFMMLKVSGHMMNVLLYMYRFCEH